MLRTVKSYRLAFLLPLTLQIIFCFLLRIAVHHSINFLPVLARVSRGFDGANSRIVVVGALLAT
jgi:CRISPR-associated DxTHG motif protein